VSESSPVWSPRSHAKSAVYSHAHPAGTAASEVVASGLKDRAGGIVQPGNAVWIALAHPGLAEPLADLLEHFAHIEDDFAALGLPPAEIGAPDRRMIAVARVINGGAP
jgi:hypothetical protein